MPSFTAYLKKTMPRITEQFNKMSTIAQVKWHWQVTINIHSNVPFYLQIWHQPGSFQPKLTQESELDAVSQGNMSLSDQNEKGHSLVNASQSARNTNSQIALKPNTQIFAASNPAWDPNSAIAILSRVELLNNLWLKKVEKTIQNCKQGEMLPDLPNLKTALYEYTRIIDQILMHCTRIELSHGKKDGILPSVSAVTESHDKLRRIINALNPGDLKKIFSDDILVAEEDSICAFLGLNGEVAKHLKNIPEEYQNHEPDEYYIKKYLQEKVDYLENSTKGNINACAKECGFTGVRAETFAAWVNASELRKHHPFSVWLDIYVENLFKYALYLTVDTPRYPFCVKTDCLACADVERYEEDEEGNPKPVKFSVPVRNCEATRYIFPQHKNRKNPIFWFHGTDHLSAMSIIEEGIEPRRGRAMQDFSDNDGFYVSTDFLKAKKWASVWSRPAVVVFEVDITAGNFQVLDLCCSRETQWSQIVKFNRTGRSKKFLPTLDLRKRFNECDCILGPCTQDGSNGTHEMPGFESWQPTGYDNSNYQLCIRSENMAKEFGKPSNIKRVLFY